MLINVVHTNKTHPATEKQPTPLSPSVTLHIPKGRSSSVPQFQDLLHVCTQYEKQQPNFAWWSNCEKNLHTVDHECWRVICLR